MSMNKIPEPKEPSPQYGMYWSNCLNCGCNLLVLDLIGLVRSGRSVEVSQRGIPKPRFCKECFATQRMRRNAS